MERHFLFLSHFLSSDNNFGDIDYFLADSEANNYRRLRAFRRWMKSQGIDCSDALEITHCGEQGISVYAKCDLEEGDVVATIPKDSCLTVKTSGAKDIIEEYGFEGPLGLSFALMYEISLSHASPWAPYLHLLPDSESLPLVWTLNEVNSLLCGTELHKVRFVESFQLLIDT